MKYLKMEFKDINLRFGDEQLDQGSLCVVKIDTQFYRTGYTLAYYDKGSFIDTQAIEDPELRDEHWTNLDDVVEGYHFMGVNVIDDIKRRNNHLYN